MRTRELVAFGASVGTTCAILPVLLRLARKYGLYDPYGPLKIHTEPIPRLGGVAIFFGLLVGISSYVGVARGPIFLWLALFLVWLAGLIDDLFDLSPWIRLIIQTFAGAMVWYAGWTLPILLHTGFDLLATTLFVLCFTNALNMLDGADGLAAGVSGIVSVGFILLGPSKLGRGFAFSLVGACVGFLLFNFPPAKIFMGDSGSNLLGFVLAFMSLDFYRERSQNHVSILVPLLFAGVPLADAARAVARRLARRTSPMYGDRDHFYDLLLRNGWPARTVALVSYLITALLVTAGLVWRWL